MHQGSGFRAGGLGLKVGAALHSNYSAALLVSMLLTRSHCFAALRSKPSDGDLPEALVLCWGPGK